MKYVLEFGIRGGPCTENLIFPTAKLAQQVASNLVRMFDSHQEDYHSKTVEGWSMKNATRRSWSSESHYIALTQLDGVARGPASSTLWKRSPRGVEHV